MTEQLAHAFAEAERLPDEDQNSLAAWILAELESERRWDEAFERSRDQLADLAEGALREHEDGRTEELDPERL